MCVCLWPLRKTLTGPRGETFTGSTSARTLISAPTEREEWARKLDRETKREREIIKENGQDKKKKNQTDFIYCKKWTQSL